MKDPINELISRVNATKAEIADAVAAGTNVGTFEIYQRLVGRSEGLQITLDLINDILTENIEDES
jgi:hypothetical protein